MFICIWKLWKFYSLSHWIQWFIDDFVNFLKSETRTLEKRVQFRPAQHCIWYVFSLSSAYFHLVFQNLCILFLSIFLCLSIVQSSLYSLSVEKMFFILKVWLCGMFFKWHWVVRILFSEKFNIFLTNFFISLNLNLFRISIKHKYLMITFTATSLAECFL